MRTKTQISKALVSSLILILAACSAEDGMGGAGPVTTRGTGIQESKDPKANKVLRERLVQMARMGKMAMRTSSIRVG